MKYYSVLQAARDNQNISALITISNSISKHLVNTEVRKESHTLFRHAVNKIKISSIMCLNANIKTNS